jgi:hypothetical protein
LVSTSVGINVTSTVHYYPAARRKRTKQSYVSIRAFGLEIRHDPAKVRPTNTIGRVTESADPYQFNLIGCHVSENLLPHVLFIDGHDYQSEVFKLDRLRRALQ